MKQHYASNLRLVLGLAAAAAACNGTETPDNPAGSGGASVVGGAPPATGGAISSGGITQATGGRQSSGGQSSTGGSATGGDATGGRPSGGTAAGGAATGGAATGGRATGGQATGGKATGGGVGTGGTSGAGGGATTSPGCGKATTAKTGNGQSITVGSSTRTYNLRIPDNYDMNHPYRLMVSYHWLNGTAQNVTDQNYYGLLSLSQASTVFVAPQGLNNGWSNSGGADVEFSRTLINQLENQLCIDTSRIFCEGFSMGGSMSYAMACAMGSAIRAVAVHSGGPMSGCVSHSTPVAYFMTHGINDSVCLYPGYGVPQLQDFAKVDGCTNPDPTQSATNFEAALPNPTSSSGACLSFTGCKAGYPVRACLFVGDHTWQPGGNWVPGETWSFISQF